MPQKAAGFLRVGSPTILPLFLTLFLSRGVCYIWLSSPLASRLSLFAFRLSPLLSVRSDYLPTKPRVLGPLTSNVGALWATNFKRWGFFGP